MFSLYGYEETISNVYRVAHPFIANRCVSTTEDLRKFYLDFLEAHQPYMPVNRSDEVFVTDERTEDALVSAYGHNATLNDLQQSEVIGTPYPDGVKREMIARVREALDTFRGLDDTLTAIFDLTIHSIVIRPSNKPQGRASHGGSSSAAIGTIWIAPRSTTTKFDIVEMLLHELTHHLLFIDERNYPHFDYGLIGHRGNRAFSAILNMSRPVDKVAHSIVVATELILGRSRFLPENNPRTVHPQTDKMIADVLTAHASITNIESAEQLLRPRISEILTRCLTACTALIPQEA